MRIVLRRKIGPKGQGGSCGRLEKTAY